MSTKLTTKPADMPDSLTLDLFHAARGFQDRLACVLVDRLEEQHGISVNQTQLGFLSALICGENTASDIARHLGITRQAAQKQVADMLGRGFLTLTPDPIRRNRSLITFTAQGTNLMRACRHILAGLDAELADKDAILQRASVLMASAFDGQTGETKF